VLVFLGGVDGLPKDSGGLLRTYGRPSSGLRSPPSELREASCVNGYSDQIINSDIVKYIITILYF
jgi:hypothetical protein